MRLAGTGRPEAGGVAALSDDRPARPADYTHPTEGRVTWSWDHQGGRWVADTERARQARHGREVNS